MNADFMNYMNGWRLAAGGLPIPPETVQDEAFLDGWKAGKKERRRAQYIAAAKYRANVRFVQIMTTTGGREDM